MAKKIFGYITVSLLLLFLLPGYVKAADDYVEAADDTEKKTSEAAGTVTAFTTTSISIVDKEAPEDSVEALPHAFKINEQTVIDGQLTEGAKVTITYVVTGTTSEYIQRTALKIKVLN
ncbi:MAG: hypothetical protein A3K83_00870 [Omnitrophica WOR_2 bacterium RBG_13_44_8b]|nr:MAG: hypothetical protein A3K83_00870 [Omnitrophica WOR_2 bacterium RBG_13_44_8b]